MRELTSVIVENLAVIVCFLTFMSVISLFGGKKVIDHYKSNGKMPNNDISSLDLESPSKDDYASIVNILK